jgi:hypothetical protein
MVWLYRDRACLVHRTESGREELLQANRPRILRARQATWLAFFVVVGVLVYVGVDLLPPWLRYLQRADARWLRRHAAVGFLDGFLIAYGPALIVAIAATVVLAYRRMRGPLSPSQARLLLLSVSVFLGLVALELGAAAWHTWLHQRPRLPAALSQTQTTRSDGTLGPAPAPTPAPSLPRQFPAPPAETETNADARVRPLKFLVIGESSGRGEPYHPWLSVGQIVGWRLEQVFPGRPIQVDIWATGGATLEVMHNKLAGLTYRPDALIVYVGHNEFQARYTWMRDVDYYLDGDRPARMPFYPVVARLARWSSLCQLIEETRERQLVDLIPPRTVTRELVDRPACTAAEAHAILVDFERRLEAIADYCETIGTLPIFIIPPSNDAGYDPSRSVLAPETTKEERIALARAVSRARALETKDRALAVRTERELVRNHPEFAETHYRLARLLEQTGSWDEAQAHYVAAREADAMPLRCPEPFREAYRAVAQRHTSVMLIDGPRVLAAKSPHGIVDDRFFHDAQHPNLRGYTALAEEILNQSGTRRAFAWPVGTPVPVVDIEACARHFQIDAARWEKICSRGSAFFRATAYIRYDPKFRNERSAAFDRSAAAIQAGITPAEAGIPGWPLPPKPATSRVIPAGRRQ